MTSESINIADKTDQILVNLCIEGRREAWDVFYTRFIPLILNSIKSTLHGYGDFGKKFARDEGVLWDIFEILYDRFRKDSLLDKCTNTKGIRTWLTTVAANQTRDWIKSQFTEDELPNRHAENSMTSIDQPLYDDSSITLADTYLMEADCEESLRDILLGESEISRNDVDTAELILAKVSLVVLSHLAELSQSNKRNQKRNFWIARITYLAIYPLIDEEIEDLIEYTKLARSDIQDKLDNVMNKIGLSEVENEASLGRAEIIRHKLIRAQAKLNHFRNDPTPEGEKIRGGLEIKINSMSNRREDLLHEGLCIPRPSAKEILELLGLSSRMNNQISTILSRLRQDFLKILKDQFKIKS